MSSFKSFVAETFINLMHGDPRMRDHADEVHRLLNKAYEPVGGLSGNGFRSPTDMVDNIHMWKLHKKNGKVTAAVMYKDKGGRKSVAMGTDGTPTGLNALKTIQQSDLSRGNGYSEVSGPALSFIKRLMGGDIKQYAIHPNDFKQHGITEPIRPAPSDDPEVLRHPELKDHFYQRELGGGWKTKVMIGKPNVKLY